MAKNFIGVPFTGQINYTGKGKLDEKGFADTLANLKTLDTSLFEIGDVVTCIETGLQYRLDGGNYADPKTGMWKPINAVLEVKNIEDEFDDEESDEERFDVWSASTYNLYMIGNINSYGTPIRYSIKSGYTAYVDIINQAIWYHLNSNTSASATKQTFESVASELDKSATSPYVDNLPFLQQDSAGSFFYYRDWTLANGTARDKSVYAGIFTYLPKFGTYFKSGTQTLNKFASDYDLSILREEIFNSIFPVGSHKIILALADIPRCGCWAIDTSFNSKALWIDSNSTIGGTLAGSLPNITGTIMCRYDSGVVMGLFQGNSGCCHASGTYNPRYAAPAAGGKNYTDVSINASWSNSVYSASAGASVVRPTSVVCHVYKRFK